MKNKFGFIPIILPVLVMVLIIGLINLTGPQVAQAQEDVSESDARLTALSLTYSDSDINVLSPTFKDDRGRYTAEVDYTVIMVTLAATAPDGYTATYGSTGVLETPAGADLGDGDDDLTITSGSTDQVTTITITVAGTAGTDQEGKMAKYVIVLTQKKPGIPAGGARLATLGLNTNPDTTPGAVSLTRMDGGSVTFGETTNGIDKFKASVPFGARTVLVEATPPTTPAGITVSSITPNKTAARATFDFVTATDTPELHRVNLPIGDTTIRVKTKATGASAEYTIMVTRRAPELDTDTDSITLGRSDGQELVPLLMPEYGPMVRDYTVEVAFDVDSTTIPVDVGTGERKELKRITEDGRLATTSSITANPHNVKLPVGKTVVGIEVDQWLRSFYNTGEEGDQNGSTSTGKYTVTIEREGPKLGAAGTDDEEGTGLRLRYGLGQTGDPDSAPESGSFGLNKMYSPDTLEYKAAVPYQHTTVTLHAEAGASPASGSDMNEVRFVSPADADTGNIGHQVDLTDDVPEKTVVIRAEAQKGLINTEYRVTLTLMPPKLDGSGDTFALCEGGQPSCTEVMDTSSPAAGQIVLKESGGDLVLFGEDTMDYDAEVDYEIDVATLHVVAADGSDPRIVKHTMPASDTSPVTSTLMVGDNVFKVDVGVTGNTSTYMVTLTRNEPKPQIHFTVLNSDGDRLGAGPLSVTLDASYRSHNLVTDTDITDDDLLTATDVRVCVADAGDGDIGDVRVSINGVTVPDCDDYLERELNEVTTNLEFDIDHPGDSSGTLHTVSISRKANSVPMFPANHILRSRTGESGVLAVHGMTITPTVDLPVAVSGTGNGDLTYQLLSVEAGDPSTELPQGLTRDLPNMDDDGKLKMSPRILDSSDRAVFNLILKVSDSDAITGPSDEDTIPFTIIVFRDESLLPPGTTIEPRLGDLRDLEVLENDKDKLDPAFSLLVYSYGADVFTDTTEVDFKATASSGATVRLEGSETSNKATAGGETTHTWEGYKLHTGLGARNTYRVTVAEGDVTRTYTVRVTRKLAARPMFDMDSAVMPYYEGIDLSELPNSAKTLPEAEGGNGDLDYALKRSRADAPDKNDFLGLMLVGKTSTPMLSGIPALDTNADLYRPSDRSEAYGVYTVNDGDIDRSASDADTMRIDVKVYRDVTLGSYTVSGGSSGDLRAMSKVYNSNRTYSHESLESYRFNAAHDVSTVTFGANPRGADGVIVSIMPTDADASTDGHQLNLAHGDNVVTVTVGNGVVRGTHLINIERPGLQLTGITITEDEDARNNSRLSDEVELVRADDMKGFNRDVYEYTATVETWVRSVKVRATAADPNARVFVNAFEIPEREGYSVVDLEIGETTIVLGASVGTDDPDPRYTVTITRKSSSAPAFEMDALNYTRMEGVDVAMAPCMAIILPEAMGGDGAPTYYLVNEERLPPGLTFNGDTREITGIPTLDEGYESDFDLILAVRDSDADMSAADGDTTSFTITITNDAEKAAEDCKVPTPEPELPANHLSSLLVTYTLDGRADISATMWSPTAFMPSDGGPYTVSIPYGAEDVQVTAVRADDGATIAMNSVRIVSGVKLDLPPQATITVRHPSFTESMVYTLNTERVSNTAPTFGGATIDHQVFESGMDIDPMALPVATGGNRTLTYTLVDHEGNLPDGLMFDASTRMLSGRPALVQDADSTLYRMTYKVEDADGQSDMVMFNITVCDPDRASRCEPTMPEPNPGYTPMGLEVSRSGGSATITWRPGDDAVRQEVAAVDLSNLTASVLATMASKGGDADSHTFSGLTEGVSYIYIVISYDASGNYKDASGNGYWAVLRDGS